MLMNTLEDGVVFTAERQAFGGGFPFCFGDDIRLRLQGQTVLQPHQNSLRSMVTSRRDADGTARFEAIQATKHGRTKLCSCFCASRNHGEVGVREVIEGSIGK